LRVRAMVGAQEKALPELSGCMQEVGYRCILTYASINLV